MFLLNLILAIVWAVVIGEFSIANLLAGFVIGYFALWVASPKGTKSVYFSKARQLTNFVLFFLWELLIASIRVAVDIVTPRHRMKPAILAISTTGYTSNELALLANTITLTPGSLSVDVAPDGNTLFVHVMYSDDIEQTRREIEQALGGRVKELLQ